VDIVNGPCRNGCQRQENSLLPKEDYRVSSPFRFIMQYYSQHGIDYYRQINRHNPTNLRMSSGKIAFVIAVMLRSLMANTEAKEKYDNL